MVTRQSPIRHTKSGRRAAAVTGRTGLTKTSSSGSSEGLATTPPAPPATATSTTCGATCRTLDVALQKTSDHRPDRDLRIRPVSFCTPRSFFDGPVSHHGQLPFSNGPLLSRLGPGVAILPCSLSANLRALYVSALSFLFLLLSAPGSAECRPSVDVALKNLFVSCTLFPVISFQFDSL